MRALQLDKSNCNKQAPTAYTVDDLPKPIHQLQLDTILTKRFSGQSLNIANAIGILDLLTSYTRLMNDPAKGGDIHKKLSLIELSQHIHQKINLASLEISAVASELDCEEERANQFAFYLKEREGKTENKLIIGSIIIGAVGSIAAEVISNNSSNTGLVGGFTIGVSLVEASLGAMMLVNKRKVDFSHPNNALTDIWKNAKVSKFFPPSLWYYLTYEYTPKNEKSLAKQLVDKWFIFGQLTKDNGKSEKKPYDLYFSKGGRYNASELKNRADMLDQTEAYVTLMKQDLKSLTKEIEALQ